MAHLKTVNTAINEFYPWMELVKGEGYFYFIPRKCSDDHKPLSEAMLLLESTSVYVNKISDLSVDSWVHEAREIFKKVIKTANIPEPVERTTYVVKFYENDGRIHTREFTSETDDEAKKSLDRYTNLKEVQLFKRIV